MRVILSHTRFTVLFLLRVIFDPFLLWRNIPLICEVSHEFPQWLRDLWQQVYIVDIEKIVVGWRKCGAVAVAEETGDKLYR